MWSGDRSGATAFTAYGERDARDATDFHEMVMAGLVPATPLNEAPPCHMIGVAGTSPAMTANDFASPRACPDPRCTACTQMRAPKFCAGSNSGPRWPVGTAAAPASRGRKRPEPGAARKVPSSTTTRPRLSTVTGQPVTVRPS